MDYESLQTKPLNKLLFDGENFYIISYDIPDSLEVEFQEHFNLISKGIGIMVFIKRDPDKSKDGEEPPYERSLFEIKSILDSDYKTIYLDELNGDKKLKITIISETIVEKEIIKKESLVVCD